MTFLLHAALRKAMNLYFVTMLLVLQNPSIMCMETMETDTGTIQATEEGMSETMILHPTVFIPILARNKEHTLATFLGCLERLRYPKNRISLW